MLALPKEGERYNLEFIWSHVLRNVHCLVVIVNCEFRLWELHGTFPIFNSWLFEIWTCHKQQQSQYTMACCSSDEVTHGSGRDTQGSLAWSAASCHNKICTYLSVHFWKFKELCSSSHAPAVLANTHTPKFQNT